MKNKSAESIQRILIAGAGKMGSWMADAWSAEYEVGVYDHDPENLRYLFHVYRFSTPQELISFRPQLLVNAVSLQNTRQVFDSLLEYLPSDCLLADIASVKNGLADYYSHCSHPFVSVHPMFGPTFADIRRLRGNHAVIIRESDPLGKEFFARFFRKLGLHLYEYGFREHDELIAYSLSVPFTSSLVFAACLDSQKVPGTTFMKHLNIARGLLNEDKYLLSEILQSPYSSAQVLKIREKLDELIGYLQAGDTDGIHKFTEQLKENINIQSQTEYGEDTHL